MILSALAGKERENGNLVDENEEIYRVQRIGLDGKATNSHNAGERIKEDDEYKRQAAERY